MNYYKVKFYDRNGRRRDYCCVAHCIDCVKKKFEVPTENVEATIIEDYKPKHWIEKFKLVFFVPPVEMNCDESIEIMRMHK